MFGINVLSLEQKLLYGKEKVQDVKDDLKGENEKALEISGVEDQALSYIKRPEIHDRHPRRRDLFHTSISKVGIHLWRKEARRDTTLRMDDYTVAEDLAC